MGVLLYIDILLFKPKKNLCLLELKIFLLSSISDFLELPKPKETHKDATRQELYNYSKDKKPKPEPITLGLDSETYEDTEPRPKEN